MDFGSYEKQPMRGPLPKGSKVLLRLALHRPDKGEVEPFVYRSGKGLQMLILDFTVAAGSYQGYSWREYWGLPRDQQNVQLTQGQAFWCNGSEKKFRAILEAARGINPDDTTSNAREAEWIDFHGLEFPARLAVDENEYNGQSYPINKVAYIITPDCPEYQDLMAGGEFIPEEKVKKQTATKQDDWPAQEDAWDGGTSSDPFMSPPPSETDEPPF